MVDRRPKLLPALLVMFALSLSIPVAPKDFLATRVDNGGSKQTMWVGQSVSSRPIGNGYSRSMTVRAGPAFAMAPTSLSSIKWLFESFVSIGGIQMGVNGLTAQLQFLAPITTISGILKSRSVGKLPLLPYSAMLATTAIFTIYGVLVGNIAIWAPHMPGVILSAAYTMAFLVNCPKEADWLPSGRSVHVGALLGLALVIASLIATFDKMKAASIIGLMGNAVCIAMFGGPLSAIKTVLQERSTKSLPFAFGIVTLINASLWCFYGAAIIHDPLIWFPNSLGVLSGVAQMILFARFGFSERK